MLLEVENVIRGFGGRTVIDGVSFGVAPGEIVGLAGPNGAGKTTLIRMLMGFLAPDAGRVRVLGDDATRRRHLHAVGWMPERPAYPPRWRVGDVLSFQAATFPSWDHALAGELTQRLTVDGSQRVSTLSRGESGRLALVLALAHRPRLLLLDDPCLGLDPAGRRLLLGELLGAAADGGAAILLSTHLLAEVEMALDRLLLLDRGNLVLDERVDGLRSSAAVAALRDSAAGPLDGAAGLEEIFVAMTGTRGTR